MRPGRHDLLSQAQVIVQGVEILGRIAEVPGIGHRHLGHRRPGRAHRVDGRAHRIHIVQRIENPENIHPGRGRLINKRARDQLRIRGVAHRVTPAQQHLQTDVGHRLPQRGQPLPRIFLQKAQRHIISRATPALHRQQLRGQPRHIRRHQQQPVGTHPGRQQRLMRIAERRIGHPEGRRILEPPGKTVRTQLDQALLGPRGRGHRQITLRQLVGGIHRRRARPVGLVHRHIGQIVQDLGAPVGRGVRGQQLRTLIDERRRHPTRPEIRIIDHREQERDVGRHATNPELRQRTTRPGGGHREVPAATGQLHQHRVEVRADLRTGVRATVQPDARTTRRAVGRDAPGIGSEPVGRVLGRDAALHGRPPDRQTVLTQPQIGQRLPRRDPQL